MDFLEIDLEIPRVKGFVRPSKDFVALGSYLWVLQNLSSTGFLLVKSPAEPSCRNPHVPQNSGERLGARTCLLRTGFFSSQETLLLDSGDFPICCFYYKPSLCIP